MCDNTLEIVCNFDSNAMERGFFKPITQDIHTGTLNCGLTGRSLSLGVKYMYVLLTNLHSMQLH